MDRTARLFLVAGAVGGAIAVIAGAFGAHAIANTVTPERLATFKTGAQFQMIHSLALLLVGLSVDRFQSAALRWSGWSFVMGVVLFSGSLYALVLTDTPVLGAIAPFGGLAFISGWLLFAAGAWKSAAITHDEVSSPPQTGS